MKLSRKISETRGWIYFITFIAAVCIFAVKFLSLPERVECLEETTLGVPGRVSDLEQSSDKTMQSVQNLANTVDSYIQVQAQKADSDKAMDDRMYGLILRSLDKNEDTSP